MTSPSPVPAYEVVFTVEPGMSDPDRVGREAVRQQVIDPKGRSTLILLALVAVVAFAVGVLTSRFTLALLGLFPVLFLVSFLFLSARGIATAIRSQASFGEPFRFVVATDGIHEYGWDSTLHLGWRHIRTTAVAAEHLVLTMRTGTRTFVPLAGLDPVQDPATVLALVQASVEAAAPPT